MPLVPGMGFVNAIRDIADSDFLSGTVRMIDALLVFVYIAIGVGITLGIMQIWQEVFLDDRVHCGKSDMPLLELIAFPFC